MSCVFVITPMVMVSGSWSSFCATAASAAGTMGYRRIARVKNATGPETKEVEVKMSSSRILAAVDQGEERMVLSRNGIEVEFSKDNRGRFSLHVRGKGIDKKTLQEEGEKLLGRIKQRYAYQKVMKEMEKQGFIVTAEKVDREHRIKIRLERLGL